MENINHHKKTCRRVISDGKGCYEENLSDELEDKRERKKLPEAGRFRA